MKTGVLSFGLTALFLAACVEQPKKVTNEQNSLDKPAMAENSQEVIQIDQKARANLMLRANNQLGQLLRGEADHVQADDPAVEIKHNLRKNMQKNSLMEPVAPAHRNDIQPVGGR